MRGGTSRRSLPPHGENPALSHWRDELMGCGYRRLNNEEKVDGGSGFFGSSTTTRFAVPRQRPDRLAGAGLAPAGSAAAACSSAAMTSRWPSNTLVWHG